MKVLGVDIGGTNTEIAVVDSEYGIVKLITFKTKSSNSFAHYIDNLSKHIEALTLNFSIDSLVFLSSVGITTIFFILYSNNSSNTLGKDSASFFAGITKVISSMTIINI